MSSPHLPRVARRNIETIARLERQLVGRRSRTERLGNAVTGFFGSLGFVFAHIIIVTVLIAANTELFPSLHPFDPYPFPLLALVIGIEFIVLTTFVLMNQKHQAWRQDQWSHLNLQICMLTEQEVTKSM